LRVGWLSGNLAGEYLALASGEVITKHVLKKKTLLKGNPEAQRIPESLHHPSPTKRPHCAKRTSREEGMEVGKPQEDMKGWCTGDRNRRIQKEGLEIGLGKPAWKELGTKEGEGEGIKRQWGGGL